MFRTHLAFGALFALAFMSISPVSNQLLFFLIALFGSLLPDIDHPHSWLGRRVKVVSWFFKHRGFIHSIFIIPLITLLISYFFHTNQYTIPLLVGYVSHLVGDMLSQEGIAPFTPFFKKQWKIQLFRVGSTIELILFFSILIADGYLLLHL